MTPTDYREAQLAEQRHQFQDLDADSAYPVPTTPRRTVQYDAERAAWTVQDDCGRTVGMTVTERGARLMRHKMEQREQS